MCFGDFQLSLFLFREIIVFTIFDKYLCYIESHIVLLSARERFMGFKKIPSQRENWKIRKRLSVTGRLQLQYKSIGVFCSKFKLAGVRTDSAGLVLLFNVGHHIVRWVAFSRYALCCMLAAMDMNSFIPAGEGKAFVLPLD